MSYNEIKAYNWTRLFVDCITELQDYGVKIEFSKKEKIELIDDGSMCYGYWDDSDPKNPILACSVKGDINKWGPFFTHEFGHFQQWRDRTEVWRSNVKFTAKEQAAIINNRPISEKRMIKFLSACRELELDAEKRAVKLFKKYNVPIDLDKYIKGANVYIFFQNYLYWYRHWCQRTPPYEIQELMNLVKPAFYNGYKNIPKDLFEGFKKYYPPCEHPQIL